ncbi:MAG: ComEA family DNA-binding protein [Ruthenibacterium sp.]
MTAWTLPPLWQKEYAPVPTQSIGEADVIHINTAVFAELCCLPQIGAVKAERIIAYRTEHGDFQNMEQLAQVDGISIARAEKLREWISFN